MSYAELAKNGVIGTHGFSSAGCDGVPFNSDTWRQPELVKVKEGRK